LALFLSQTELIDEFGAAQQRSLTEFEAALGHNQSGWSDQTKGLAQQTLNAGLRAARDTTAAMLEEAGRMNVSVLPTPFSGCGNFCFSSTFASPYCTMSLSELLMATALSTVLLAANCDKSLAASPTVDESLTKVRVG